MAMIFKIVYVAGYLEAYIQQLPGRYGNGVTQCASPCV